MVGGLIYRDGSDHQLKITMLPEEYHSSHQKVCNLLVKSLKTPGQMIPDSLREPWLMFGYSSHKVPPRQI